VFYIELHKEISLNLEKDDELLSLGIKSRNEELVLPPSLGFFLE
jgi:hypothetical protein